MSDDLRWYELQMSTVEKVSGGAAAYVLRCEQSRFSPITFVMFAFGEHGKGCVKTSQESPRRVELHRILYKCYTYHVGPDMWTYPVTT